MANFRGVKSMAIDNGQVRLKKSLSSQEKLFVEAQNQCALCNTALDIKVESYLEDYYLREEAECPNCKIKTRVKNHKMQ
jgi:hypothetical protein